jgi:hypothetical protein
MANKRKFRITLNTLTSWGASVVIIGVMAKLLRWHAADTLIIVGMLTEAILFFILGFQSDEIRVIKEDGDAVESNQVADVKTVVNTPTRVLVDPTPFNMPELTPIDLSKYHDEMEKMTAHLKNLNHAYENMTRDLDNVEQLTVHTTRVKDESEKLAKNLTALNAVYRNMLNAMNMPNA